MLLYQSFRLVYDIHDMIDDADGSFVERVRCLVIVVYMNSRLLGLQDTAHVAKG